MGWKSKKNKLRIRSNKHYFDKNNEIKYLKIINRLPEDLIRYIINYLYINVLNIIKPIINVYSLYNITSYYYWLNFYVELWIRFNIKNNDTKNNIIKYFIEIKSFKYFKYNRKIYHKDYNKSKKILKKFVKKDVKKFGYDIDQYERNVSERLIIKYTDNIILDIINSKC